MMTLDSLVGIQIVFALAESYGIYVIIYFCVFVFSLRHSISVYFGDGPLPFCGPAFVILAPSPTFFVGLHP